jgi:RimJ/RimL family protein N-acetyltransferase
MTAMEAWARAHGARKLSLTYLSHNTAAQRLYTRLGYHEEARIPAQYWIAGQPCDAVWAAKWMSTPVP